MLDFILKYWVEFLFGLIALGITTFLKSFWKMYKKEHERSQKELCDKISKEVSDKFNESHNETLNAYQLSKEDDEKLQAQIDNVQLEIASLTKGLLSVQGKQFKQECRDLLKGDHIITLDEFQDLDADHEAYNGLGGNHNGDHLFGLVKMKFESSLTNPEK